MISNPTSLLLGGPIQAKKNSSDSVKAIDEFKSSSFEFDQLYYHRKLDPFSSFCGF
jgi:hypothetical protein